MLFTPEDDLFLKTCLIDIDFFFFFGMSLPAFVLFSLEQITDSSSTEISLLWIVAIFTSQNTTSLLLMVFNHRAPHPGSTGSPCQLASA